MNEIWNGPPKHYRNIQKNILPHLEECLEPPKIYQNPPFFQGHSWLMQLPNPAPKTLGVTCPSDAAATGLALKSWKTSDNWEIFNSPSTSLEPFWNLVP